MRLLILTRGLPGSGKSTLANKLKDEAQESGYSAAVYSTDDYWMQDGKYKFDITKLNEAHEWNLDRVTCGIKEYDYVIVDNTNIVWKDFKKYVRLAITHNCRIMLAEPMTDWKHNIDVCDKMNTHNVPKETIDRMYHKYQGNAEIIGYAKDMMDTLNTYVEIYEYDPLGLF